MFSQLNTNIIENVGLLLIMQSSFHRGTITHFQYDHARDFHHYPTLYLAFIGASSSVSNPSSRVFYHIGVNLGEQLDFGATQPDILRIAKNVLPAGTKVLNGIQKREAMDTRRLIGKKVRGVVIVMQEKLLEAEASQKKMKRCTSIHTIPRRSSSISRKVLKKICIRMYQMTFLSGLPIGSPWA